MRRRTRGLRSLHAPRPPSCLLFCHKQRLLADGATSPVLSSTQLYSPDEAFAAPRPAADIDELANPLQAAVVSAICFTVGAALPLLSAAFIHDPTLRLGILAGATTGEGCRCWGHPPGWPIVQWSALWELGCSPAVSQVLWLWEHLPQPHRSLRPFTFSPPAVGLCLFGFLGAFLGGANVVRGGLRVVIGGWIALGIVYGVGRALNVDVA